MQLCLPGKVAMLLATSLSCMATETRVRLQAYLPPDIADQIKQKAEAAQRPESWEVLRLLKVGLAADQQNISEK